MENIWLVVKLVAFYLMYKDNLKRKIPMLFLGTILLILLDYLLYQQITWQSISSSIGNSAMLNIAISLILQNRQNTKYKSNSI